MPKGVEHLYNLDNVLFAFNRIDLGCRKALSTAFILHKLLLQLPHGSLMPKGVEHLTPLKWKVSQSDRIDLGCRKALSTSQSFPLFASVGPHGSLMPKGVEHLKFAIEANRISDPHGSLMPKGVEHFRISKSSQPETIRIDLGCRKALST